MFLLAPFIVLSTQESYQHLLDQAEALRTQSPTKTIEIVSQLEAQYQALSQYQQQQFKFIKAYMLGFQGKQNESIALATEISNSQYPKLR